MTKTYTNEEVIQKLREAAGWKGAGKLAHRMGVSDSFLSRVMHGKRKPTAKVLSAIGLTVAIVDAQENNTCNADSGTA